MRGSRLPGAKGINGGIKLSTTARFARQENPRGIRVFSWRRLPEPGWGPGGRRFKSCLPDWTKAPLRRGFCLGQVSMLSAWVCTVCVPFVRTSAIGRSADLPCRLGLPPQRVLVDRSKNGRQARVRAKHEPPGRAWSPPGAVDRARRARKLVSVSPGQRSGSLGNRRMRGWRAGVRIPGFAYVGRVAAGSAETGSQDETHSRATLRFGLPLLPDRMESSSTALM
jgi:hypothetical protein